MWTDMESIENETVTRASLWYEPHVGPPNNHFRKPFIMTESRVVQSEAPWVTVWEWVRLGLDGKGKVQNEKRMPSDLDETSR